MAWTTATAFLETHMHPFLSLTLPRTLVFRTSIAAALLVAAGLPLTASAQQAPYVGIQQGLTAEQLRVTGLDTLTGAQLEALNALLRERESELATALQAAAPSGATAVGQAQDVTAANGAASMADSRRDDGSRDARLLGFTDEPIRSRLKGTVSEWDVGTVFELENGQQWKVLKGKARLYKPLQSPEVMVVPGLTGRWFLQVDPDVAKPRVYLIN